MPSIHYKFKASKDYDSMVIDGTGIALGDLKVEIIQQKKLGKVTDTDLVVMNAQTNEEYKDETTVIPKNTSLIVRRVPASKTGGLAAYVQNKLTNGMRVYSSTRPMKQPDMKAPLGINLGTDKQHYNPYTDANYNTRIPPSNYVCFRCNQKGHYISHCPTNDDPAYDISKVKRATGIPKTFLKTVDDASGTGVMMDPEGKFVVAQINDRLLNKRATLVPTYGKEMSFKDEYEEEEAKGLNVYEASKVHVPSRGQVKRPLPTSSTHPSTDRKLDPGQERSSTDKDRSDSSIKRQRI